MKKMVYGFIIMAVLAMGFAACDTSSLSGVVNGPSGNTEGPFTVTFTLDGGSYTQSVAKGTVINDAYVAEHKGALGGSSKFAVTGLSLHLAGQAGTVTADIIIPLVWKFNGATVETWHTVTFTVNGEAYPVQVPEGASLAAGQQAVLEAFLGVPSGSLASVTWSDLSTITGDKEPEAITVTTFTVTFDLDYEHENKITAQQVVSGGSVAALPDPTRAEYSFGGWWTQQNGGGTAFTGTTAVSADITVYAKWTEVIGNPPLPPGGGLTANVQFKAGGRR
jgi:uncharacterized repeat protein (TIGR02543 family)